MWRVWNVQYIRAPKQYNSVNGKQKCEIMFSVMTVSDAQMLLKWLPVHFPG